MIKDGKPQALGLAILLWTASLSSDTPIPAAEMARPVAALHLAPAERLRDALGPALRASVPVSPLRPGWKPGSSVKKVAHPISRTPLSAKDIAKLVVPLPKETQAYKRTFRILLSNLEKTDRYDKLIAKYAAEYRLNPRLLKAIIAAESEFNTDAVSPRGARGLMQLIPATAEEMGVPGEKLHDPEANIRAGAAYLHFLFVHGSKKFKVDNNRQFAQAPLWLTERVIAAYNAGPRFLNKLPLHTETRLYVRKVVLFLRTSVTDLRRLH